MVVRRCTAQTYLVFLAGALLAPQDAGVHRLHVFDHQQKDLFTEAEHELRGQTDSEDLNKTINVTITG